MRENLYLSRITAAAAALTIAITTTIAAWVYGGQPLEIVAALASLIALLGWAGTTFRRAPQPPAAFVVYITEVLALMLVYSEQWYMHAPSRMLELVPHTFSGGAGIGDHAFIAVFPLASSALLMLGALAYYHQLSIGRFAAWMLFSWGTVFSVAAYVSPMMTLGVHYFGGMLTAPIAFAVGVIGIRRLLQPARAAEQPVRASSRGALDARTRLSVVVVAVFIPLYATVLYLQAGLMVVGIVCGAMIAGFIVWLRTTVRRPPAPPSILPAYLLTLALFLMHVLEEYTQNFPGRIAAAAHVHWTLPQFVEVIVLLGPLIWIAGAIGIYKQHPVGNFIAWFLFVGMMLGEPAHVLVFPLMEPGPYHYFPGMWSSLFPMVPAVYGIWRMLADDRALTRPVGALT